MHCYGDGVFTTIPWVASGLDPADLANSALVEYCNNEDKFGSTAAYEGPGGFLSNLDSQQLLTYDNLTRVGEKSELPVGRACDVFCTTYFSMAFTDLFHLRLLQ